MRTERNRDHAGRAEVSEVGVLAGAELVVVLRAQADLDGEGERRFPGGDARRDAEFDIDALAVPRVRLAVAQLEGHKAIRFQGTLPQLGAVIHGYLERDFMNGVPPVARTG